jgi:hypothetical protein
MEVNSGVLTMYFNLEFNSGVLIMYSNLGGFLLV